MQKQRLRLHDLLDDPSTYFRMRHAWDGNTPLSKHACHIRTRTAVPQRKTLERIAETYKIISNDERSTHEIVLWMLDRSPNQKNKCKY